MRKHYILYLMLLPGVVYFLLFRYFPMYGAIIAFKDYRVLEGFWGSPWVGLKHFNTIFSSPFFYNVLGNTLIISIAKLLAGLPVAICFALLLNEVRLHWFKRSVQTITYLPHFLSEVTITGIVLMLVYNGVHSTGVIAQLFVSQGWIEPNASIIQQANYFRPLYIVTGIWKESGYNSIVYYAAIMGIPPALYEALKVDGGNKLQEIRYVTIPCIAPTLIIMVIMRIGRMLSIGYERVLLLYNTNIYVTADVLSTFEQRIGIISGNYGIGSASSLFNSLIAFALVIGANTISRNISKTSLW